MVDVDFVTTNPGKLREARAILRPFGVRVRWVRRELPELQADDLETVARGKAAALRRSRGYVLVEDAGLFVPSLQGFPGVYSAHVLRIWGFGPLLELLRRRPRSAFFRSVAVLRQGKRYRSFTGEVRGRISPRARGREGFGFDPIFVPNGSRRTFAEMAPSEKDRLSHRARSMRQVGEYLRTAARSRQAPRAPRSARRRR